MRTSGRAGLGLQPSASPKSSGPLTTAMGPCPVQKASFGNGFFSQGRCEYTRA